MATRRKFTAENKAKYVLEIISGEKSLAAGQPVESLRLLGTDRL